MITIKNKLSIQKMEKAGKLLVEIFDGLLSLIIPGVSASEIDASIEQELCAKDLVSMTKGYMGYRHVSCISINDEVVHGIPYTEKKLKKGDLVKIDICASWRGYCADMARSFIVESGDNEIKRLVDVAYRALDKGIEKAVPGNRLSDISAAIQCEVESNGFNVVRDFAGHGIGKKMHEEPEILNYGEPGKGPVLRPGMAFAIEPMVTMGDYNVYVTNDGWTVKTTDKSLSAHVEDTVVITNNGPKIITRHELSKGF